MGRVFSIQGPVHPYSVFCSEAASVGTISNLSRALANNNKMADRRGSNKIKRLRATVATKRKLFDHHHIGFM